MSEINHPGETIDPLLAQARAYNERGDWQQAETLYRQILDRDSEQVEALEFLGVRALMAGGLQRAAQLLERAVQHNHTDAKLLKNYGLACLGTNQREKALRAFSQALEIQPDLFVARLYRGNIVETLGDDTAALHDYYGAIITAQANGRWLSPQTTPQGLHELVPHAMRFVDIGRKKLLDATLEPIRQRYGDEALRRVDRCVDSYLGLRPVTSPDPQQKPKFLYFPELPASKFYARELFDWYEELESNTAAIRDELLTILREDSGIEPFLKFDSPDDVPKFLGAGKQGAPAWDAFFLYRHGERYEENCSRCPRTAAAVERLPLIRIGTHAPEICFSILSPGTHILPHHGVTNIRLVTHLPLIVPTDCALRVGGQEHAWQEGRCITFDDTMEHEAWNRSDQTRVVLIIDVWNPHLTPIEREALPLLIDTISRFNRQCGISELR